MYGTVAKMKTQPGSGGLLAEMSRQFANDRPPGMVATLTYQMDTDPDVYMMAVVFESKDAYVANAGSPQQHARYEQYRALLAEEPEWHDGEIVHIEGSVGS